LSSTIPLTIPVTIDDTKGAIVSNYCRTTLSTDGRR